MRTHRYLKLLLAGFATSLFLMGLAPAGASSANISHSYHSSTPVTDGSLVSLDAQRTDYIEAANTSNGTRLLGIAVATNDSLLAVDPTAGAVQVATSGTASAIVSTLSGPITVGDQVAVSPFNGIGMKATLDSRVIGLAQTAFDGTSSDAVTQTVKDKSGKSKTIKVGYVRLGIGVGTASSAANSTQLNSLQKIAKSLTGHIVSTARIVLSLIVAFVAVLAMIVLIYASIYGSIISIGRNPLAKYAVFRTLSAVLGMAAMTAAIATVIIVLLLR